MITIKTEAEFNAMRTAGKLLAELFERLKEQVEPGITSLAIDAFIADYIKQRGLVSAMLGYAGTYKHVSCISINDVVVHGIPSGNVVLSAGDLVKIDVCASWQGYCADMARCFFVGKIPSAAVERLVSVAGASLDAGIQAALPGNKLGDVSAAIQREVEAAGFGVVRDFAGHGIGRKMHESPEILNYGRPGRGPVMREGMAFALEPMITQGRYDVYVAQDGWTVRTVDKSLAAHVEDTVLITQHGPQVITRL
jgi:methionyl aminopeptidase